MVDLADTTGEELIAEPVAVVERDSRQPRFDDGNTDPIAYASVLLDWVYREHLVEPTLTTDTREYDNWLIDFANNEPHLVGILSSVISKDKNRAWFLTGGKRQVQVFGDRLRGVEGGEGWRNFMSLQARSYYNTNMGAVTEVETVTGLQGDALQSLYHVDPTRVRLLDRWNTPIRYYPRKGRVQDWLRGEFFRTVSNPDPRENWRGVGMCAINRCLSLAKMLIAIYEHDLEQLGAEPPKGYLVGDNISQTMYDLAIAKREEAKRNGQSSYSTDVLVLLAQNANSRTDLRFIPYSQLPTNFDLEQFTYLIMLGYALAFGFDAQEFYPIKQGSFGRGAEANIQAEKTTYKGDADFSLEYQGHIQEVMPDTLFFEFDRNDMKGDLQKVELDQARVDLANSMYAQPYALQSGITLEEYREYLAKYEVIPPEWTEATDFDATSDTERIRREYRDLDHLVRQSEKRPDEPIVRFQYDPKLNRGFVKTLWQRGGDLRDSHRNWAVNYTRRDRGDGTFEVKPSAQRGKATTLFHDPFLALIVKHGESCDCAACQTSDAIGESMEQFRGYKGVKRAEEGETLFSSGEVLITTGDVDLAIAEAYEINEQFGDLLNAKQIVRVIMFKPRLFTWNETANRYQYDNGQFVSAATVRDWTRQSIESSTDKVTALAQQVADGSLSPADFGLIAREEIKREYIRQYVAGRGGRDQMTPADWGRMGQQLKTQYEYLDGFVSDIGSMDLTDGQIRQRLNMYMESAKHSYYSGMVAARGIPYDRLPAYPGDGSTLCLTNCKCHWDFTELYQEGVLVGYECRWRRSALESCDTCVQRESEWNSIVILFSEN